MVRCPAAISRGGEAGSMGEAYDFRCTRCGYRAPSMVSGYSCGMFSHVHAVLCRDCQALHRAILPGHPADLPLDEGQNLSELAIARYGLTCPVSPSHRVEPWAQPGPWPRCGETIAGEEPILMWD